MNYRYMVIYEKRNGELLYRYLTLRPHYEKGTRTSMGWLVKDIKVFDNGNLVSSFEYDNKFNRRLKINEVIRFNYNRILDIFKFVAYAMVVYYLFVK